MTLLFGLAGTGDLLYGYSGAFGRESELGPDAVTKR